MTTEQIYLAYILFLKFAGVIFVLLLVVYAVAIIGIIKSSKRKDDE